MFPLASHDNYRHDGFFVLRTPLLPFDALLNWSEGLEAPSAIDDDDRLAAALETDRTRLRRRLGRITERTEIREALFLASPAFLHGAKLWREKPNSKKGRSVERTLVRYFERMTSRCTPFGLFAGCSLGDIGSMTHLELEPISAYERHTRLDMGYLSTLVETLERKNGWRHLIQMTPNHSLYSVCGQYHYAEGRESPAGRIYHLVRVDHSEALDLVLSLARGGRNAVSLATALTEQYPGVTREEAHEFIDALAKSQILVSNLTPQVTGPEPIEALGDGLSSIPEAVVESSKLQRVRNALKALDHDGIGLPPERYDSISDLLQRPPETADRAQLFQVDLFKPAAQATLGPAPMEELHRAIGILARIAPVDNRDILQRFHSAFEERYGDREVPLLEVLDEDIGIGFEARETPAADPSPLLRKLSFDEGATQTGPTWTVREQMLINKVITARAERAIEITLGEGEIKAMETDLPLPLPDAFAAMIRIAGASSQAIENGEFRIMVDAVAGPAGANLLGRFCHGNSRITEAVRRHLRVEEALRPDAVFAEIVHLAEGRLGSLLVRPVLRDYEIPYLGRSGAPPDRQIPPDDLYVSVAGDRVILTSRRLGREVIPRLSSAHNFNWRSLGVYRFLCILQSQGTTPGLAWSWGALEGLAFLPRVRCGRTILARARWQAKKTEFERFSRLDGPQLYREVQCWRRERGMPRRVVLADSDQELLVDFDNVLSTEALVDSLAKQESATFLELFPDAGEQCVQGPEGRFTAEFIVPFVSTRKPRHAAASPRIVESSSVRRRFAPGTEWLYAKFYTSATTADRLLVDLVRPLAAEALSRGAADRWFFIRYADPEHHLRVRFQGDPKRLISEVLPLLNGKARRFIDEGLIWRVQIDTYERELERYGGAEGIAPAEEVFFRDSEAVAALQATLRGDEAADRRWRFALRGVHDLLDRLGLDLEGKRTVVHGMRHSYEQEFRVGGDLRQQLRSKHRALKHQIEDLLRLTSTQDGPFQEGMQILEQRTRTLNAPLARLSDLATSARLTISLEEIAMSLVHMHVNRVLRSSQRAHELVIYYLLDRIYESQIIRASKAA